MNTLNTEPNQAKSALAEDLTVVFLRGNGSPRTFRVPLPALQRALTALGFSFCVALFLAVFFAALAYFRGGERVAGPSAVATAPAATDSNSGGIWNSLSGDGEANDSELAKEVNGLRQDIARLQTQADGRKELPKGYNNELLQFFGPRARPIPENDSMMRVKNAKVETSMGDLNISFELHNVEPSQKQQRGYIVVLAKTPDMMMVYPPTAFAPTQNIVLDYTKGETFGVSRFRQAKAVFPAAPFANRKPKFQILLIAHDGTVVANHHVEGQ